VCPHCNAIGALLSELCHYGRLRVQTGRYIFIYIDYGPNARESPIVRCLRFSATYLQIFPIRNLRTRHAAVRRGSLMEKWERHVERMREDNSCKTFRNTGKEKPLAIARNKWKLLSVLNSVRVWTDSAVLRYWQLMDWRAVVNSLTGGATVSFWDCSSCCVGVLLMNGVIPEVRHNDVFRCWTDSANFWDGGLTTAWPQKNLCPLPAHTKTSARCLVTQEPLPSAWLLKNSGIPI
jgi:hypothetical protein